MSVSLCLMARNEDEKLPVCLQSAADLVDETIVVDTGSTDGTRVLAAKLFGAHPKTSWWSEVQAGLAVHQVLQKRELFLTNSLTGLLTQNGRISQPKTSSLVETQVGTLSIGS